jgi:hypothetical protein
MEAEYDFSKGEHGKFHEPNATYSFPVYLEPDVDAFMSQLAEEKNIDIQQLINEWLRSNINLIKSVKQAG